MHLVKMLANNYLCWTDIFAELQKEEEEEKNPLQNILELWHRIVGLIQISNYTLYTQGQISNYKRPPKTQPSTLRKKVSQSRL